MSRIGIHECAAVAASSSDDASVRSAETRPSESTATTRPWSLMPSQRRPTEAASSPSDDDELLGQFKAEDVEGLLVADRLRDGVVSVHGTGGAFCAVKRDGSAVVWGKDSVACLVKRLGFQQRQRQLFV